MLLTIRSMTCAFLVSQGTCAETATEKASARRFPFALSLLLKSLSSAALSCSMTDKNHATQLVENQPRDPWTALDVR